MISTALHVSRAGLNGPFTFSRQGLRLPSGFDQHGTARRAAGHADHTCRSMMCLTQTST